MAYRLAVLLSGNGSTLENIFGCTERGQLPAEVAVVLSSRDGAFGIERASRRGIPTELCVRREYPTRSAYSQAVFELLDPYAADLVVLAGFMMRLNIPERYAGRVINVHPSLIPAFCGKGFYGSRVHEAVLRRGCKLTGCTVHFCDDQYDHGPIILQKAIEVASDETVETLARRVQELEREIYPQVINLILEGRVKIDGRRTLIKPKSPD